MSANANHPILLVNPRPQDRKQRIIEGFSEPREVVEVTRKFREALVSSINASSVALKPTFAKYPDIPAVVALRLHPDAMAKTHRPMMLLSRVGMLPIGTRRFGEMLLPATTASLQLLAEIAATNEAKTIRANLSTIESIDSWGKEDALRWSDLEGRSLEQKKRSLGEWLAAGKPLLLERFTSTTERSDEAIRSGLLHLLKQLRVDVSDAKFRISHGAAGFVRLRSLDDAMMLAAFPGVHSLVPADEFAPIEVRPQMFADIGEASDAILPAPSADLPIVGVIDSGIERKDKMLRHWLAGQEIHVLPPDTDHYHGTFVAGLIAGSRSLNDGDQRFPASVARIVDVGTLGTGLSSADVLIHNISEAVAKYPHVKVWNCSFGSKAPGHPEQFSQFAQDLDALADEHNVLFVVAAGNYEGQPRAWPPTTDLFGEDRLSMPGESLRALTVGSVAHLPALVQPNDPSPFSRRGPGAAKTPKPDVTHRGGNCTKGGAFLGAGVRSLLPGGRMGESVGTSFSTPLVSALAANVWQTLDQHILPSDAETVKALIIHAAALSSPKRQPDERDYHGFGVPESVLDVLFCSSDTFTLMFQPELSDGIFWEKDPFPVPACLHPEGTHLRAEVFMTLVYSPPLDGRHGAEYVRANIDASFGSYEPGQDGKLHHHGLVPLEAPRREDLYEKAMVEHGFKWSPVKVYHGRFARGKAATRFRLRLDLLRRAGEPSSAEPMRATVIITFKGIDADQPVYADGLRALQAANWTSSKVTTRARLQV